MSFLLRFCFWFGLVIYMLPFDEVRPVDTTHLTASTAGQAVEGVTRLCQAQPELCRTALESSVPADIQAPTTIGQVEPSQTSPLHEPMPPLPTPRPATP